MRILITGSRTWSDAEAILQALMKAALGVPYSDVTLVSGACPTGADAIAERLAAGMGMVVERHPADWYRYGAAAGPARNAEMVDLGADICLAFQQSRSRGTANAIALARAAKIPTVVDARP